MFQDDVAHVETKNVFFQPVLQILKEPKAEGETRLNRIWGVTAVHRLRRTLPLADVFDFRQLGEEPLLILSSKTLCQLVGQHEVVYCDR